MRFGPWIPIDQASAVAPERPGVLQARGDGLLDLPLGKSAMVFYAASGASEALRDFLRGPGAAALAAAASAGARWIRFAEVDQPGDRLARLLRQFSERFGAVPLANRQAYGDSDGSGDSAVDPRLAPGAPAMKIGVLVSGGGSNLQALIDAGVAGTLGPARIALVGSNVPGCLALTRAERAGVPTFSLDHRSFPNRVAFDEAVAARLAEAGVELVVLAGFMRILSGEFVRAHAGRLINIHPALLPAFPGLHPQRQALDQGVKFSGCTVHFVDEGTDSGPIIAQTIVPVLEGDDENTLGQRILAEEHRLLPAVVRAIAEGRTSLEGRRVRIAGGPASSGGRDADGGFAMMRLRSL